MCGRFTQSKSLGEYQQRFGFFAGQLEFAPRFNLAPGQEALAVLAGTGGGGAKCCVGAWCPPGPNKSGWVIR